MQGIWLAFLTGLTTGGFSCLAVQGGLLASSVAQDKEGEIQKSGQWKATALFVASKLLVYTILGFGLGLLGSKLSITSTFQGWMQIFAGLFMLATAARILNLHPIFRYFVIQPPRWAYRFMRAKALDSNLFTPAFLGAMTVFIPCGVTQAMMVTAIATGNPLAGSAIMFAFTLGTSPVFFAIGVAAVKLLESKVFAWAAAAVIASLGILSINSGQILRGSLYTLQNFYKAATTDINSLAREGKVAGVSTDGRQEVTIQVASSGYLSSATVVKTGVPVSLQLVTNNTKGCTRAFTIPSLRISKVLPQTGTETIEFTPQKPGRLAYTCSMGMFGGELTVIN